MSGAPSCARHLDRDRDAAARNADDDRDAEPEPGHGLGQHPTGRLTVAKERWNPRNQAHASILPIGLIDGQGIQGMRRARRAPARSPRTFTARAATSRTVTAEKADSSPIIAFARRDSGIASVGLNAIEFVSET